jgi:WD40 repeat protein
MLVSVQDDNVALWDVSTGEFIRFADTPPDLGIEAVAFPSAEALWVGGVVEPAVDEPYSVAVSIDPTSGRVIGTARHNDDEFGHVVTSIALSPDGSTLVTGGTDRRIFVWDTSDLSAEVVADLVFLNDDVLLAADLERRVIMWDVDAGRSVGELSGPTDGVNALDLRPDGGFLIAGGEDDTLWIWDMRVDSWLEGACDLAGRNMTVQEWARFRLGEQPVRHCEQHGPNDWPLAEYPASAG